MRMFALSAGLLLASPVLAQQQAAALPDGPAPAAPAMPEKKICRAETATGSIMAKRVCHSRAEWDAMAGSNARVRDDFQDKTTNPGLPSLAGRPGS